PRRSISARLAQVSIDAAEASGPPDHRPSRTRPGRRSEIATIRRMNCEREVVGLPRWTDAEGRDVVPHGFRSSFKDWATDWTPSPAEIVEAAKRGEIVEAFPRDLVEV